MSTTRYLKNRASLPRFRGIEIAEYHDQAELVHDIAARWNTKVPQI